MFLFRIFFLTRKSRRTKQGKKNRKTTKIFLGCFWIQFFICFVFVTSGTYINQIGRKFCKICSNFIPPKFLVNFGDQFFILYIFTTNYGMMAILEGSRSFEKQIFCFFETNRKNVMIFVQILIFSKNDGQNWGEGESP